MRTRHLLLLTFIVLTASFAAAQETKADSANATSHPIKVSLITFYPGDEIFEVFGHSEILLSDSTGNYYINYGVFDFNLRASSCVTSWEKPTTCAPSCPPTTTAA
ncbi:MAG: hypothetical protein IJ925_09455 [Muribaculaceae bacterium]|nr:hypothetical protein [Muribaculaceae bacterium]